MNSSRENDNGFQDIVHATILLISVPILFYGGYLLVSNSTTVKINENENLIANGGEAIIKRLRYEFKGEPLPGQVWIQEVDSLKQQLESATTTNVHELKIQERLMRRLDLIRTHCKEHEYSVPETFSPRTPLGGMLINAQRQIDKLSSKDAALPKLSSWESEFNETESTRKNQKAQRINERVRQLTSEMAQSQQAKLNQIFRQNSELADQIQRNLNETQTIGRATKEAIDKQRRQQAFLRDKNEIDQLLIPFTTPAYFQLGNDYTDWRKTAKPEPISYRQLEAAGALSDDFKGIENLAIIGSPHPNSKHARARPRGSFPIYHVDGFSGAAIEKVKRAQELIRKHSIYLIESGLLNP